MYMGLMRPFLHIAPRALAIAIVVFFSLFIFEGFVPGFMWIDSLRHLFVAVAILGATIIAWRWPDTGGWLFLIVGIFYMQAIFSEAWWNGLIVGGIPLITGFLFLAEGVLRDRYPDIWSQHVQTLDY